MRDLGILKAAIALLAVTAAGCGMQGGTPSVGPLSSAARQEAAPLAPLDANKKLAGTYNGSIEWTIGSETSSGTLEIILRFHDKNSQGPFRITVDGQTYNYRFYGKIKTKTAEEAQLVFAVYNGAGIYVTGTGTIANGVFAGTAHSPTGSDPAVAMKFNVTKGQ
jgi:hypothetical protein